MLLLSVHQFATILIQEVIVIIKLCKSQRGVVRCCGRGNLLLYTLCFVGI